MMKQIENVCVFGNTLTTLLTALFLLNNNKNLKIKLIKTKSFNELDICIDNKNSILLNKCNIDHISFSKNTKSLFKISTAFKYLNDINEYSAHFLDIKNDIDTELSEVFQNYYQTIDYQNRNYISRIEHDVINLCDSNLFSVNCSNFSLFENSGFQIQYLNAISYLTTLVESYKNITIFEEPTIEIIKNENGIDYIKLDDQKIYSDLYIDTSDSHLSASDEQFISLEHIIKSKHVRNYKINYNNKYKEIKPYTDAVGLKQGWLYNVSTFEYNNLNYFYNENEKDESIDENRIIEINEIELSPGYLNNSWMNNTITLGKSCYFLEPINSNEFAISLESLTYLSKLLQSEYITDFDVIEYNQYINELIQNDIYKTISNQYLYHKNMNDNFWKDFFTKDYFKNIEHYHKKCKSYNNHIYSSIFDISKIYEKLNDNIVFKEKSYKQNINYYQWLRNNIFETN